MVIGMLERDLGRAPCNPSPAATIGSLLRERGAVEGDRIALEEPEGPPLSYGSLWNRVSGLAASLESCGVASEAAGRVAVVMPNGRMQSIALLGACCAGIAVPLNPAYREEEFRAYLRRTGAAWLLVVAKEDGPAVAAAVDVGVRVLRLGVDTAAIDADSSTAVEPRRPPRPDDLAVVLLTSGSTGRGKVVPLTHRNLCGSAADVARSVRLGRQDRCLSMWEQFHIGGVVDLLLAPLASGGQIVSAGGFDAARFFALLESTRPTWFQGVPVTLRELCHHATAHGIDPRGSSLRFLRSVAAALPEPWMQELEACFGVPVIQTFGMTEASPLITSNCLPPGLRKPGSTGKPCGPEVRIMGEGGRPLPPGQRGQIAVRGDNVFGGYENDPQANAEAFSDGWFYTGDVGYLDEDGYLFLTGRVKEMINRGGEKISPHEVDEALLQHPAVAQAATFGVPHPRLGEEVAAALVLEPGQRVSEVELQRFVEQRLAGFKVPRRLLFLDELPRCPIGKIRRRELAELVVPELTATQRTPPRTGLEATLAALWARELDLAEVGIDDDFSELGGDSLSSVRILVAIQTLLGVEIPERAAARFDTVRNMANALVGLGCSSEPSRRAAAERRSDGAGAPADEGVERALRTATERQLRGDRLAKDPSGARTLTEFGVMIQSRFTRDTPSELDAILGPRRGARAELSDLRRLLRSLVQERSRSGFRRTWEMAVRYVDTRRCFARDISASDRPMLWVREEIGESADRFHAHTGSCASKTLVVGFTGHTMRLMMPVYRLLCHLDPDGHELLLLRNPGRDHYRSGIPGFGAGLEAVARGLDDFVRQRGYQRVVAMGTSAGALPAIAVALANGWERAIACGADAMSSHPELRELIVRLIGERGDTSDPEIIATYARRNPRDCQGAAEIASVVPQAQLLAEPRSSAHMILHRLYLNGELRSFLTRCLARLER
jgi:acyl-CoA synthetase (AMP-forming)/AMP-acid ligase II/acyl carrier protein